MPGFEPSDLFDPPTSVLLCGGSRALVRWVAYALVADRPGGFVWGHVRLEDEVFEEDDPLKTPLLPRDQVISVLPSELVRDEFEGNVAVGGLLRPKEDEELVRRFADFVRLPKQTQDLLSGLPRGGASPVLVLSGGHRIAAFYTAETEAPTIRSIVGSGASMLIIWEDAPLARRFLHDHVLQLKGYETSKWKDAVLTVEKGWPTGPLQTGTVLPLRGIAPVASVLSRTL